MFKLTRKRREAKRQKELDEVFHKADTSGNGKITTEQMINIFKEAEITIPDIEDEISKICDKNGEIDFKEFMKFAMNTDLCMVEFHDKVFHKPSACCKTEKSDKKSKAEGSQKEKVDSAAMDRIEVAFRKFDINQDGFLSRDEFDEMMKNVDKEQADRIFKSCDTAGDNRISLKEFRTMMAKLNEAKH